LPTGDGGMMVTDNEEIYERLYGEWAFGGESPAFMTLNFRMNEMTAAVGRAQLQRVSEYIETYNRSLAIMEAAIRDCEWLVSRYVPEEAQITSYGWTCLWEGDKYGLDFDRFKQLNEELKVGLGIGFQEGRAPYQFDFFRISNIYGNPACPIRCPLYQGSYDYEDGLCPNAEYVLPRRVGKGAMIEPEQADEFAEKMNKLIDMMNQG